MMKTLTRTLIVLAELGLLLVGTGIARAETISLSPGFSEPMTETGTSGGATSTSNCGSISGTPNHKLVLTQDFDYLRVAAGGAENLTLLVRGPGGEFCAPSNPQQSGYWQQGSYDIFVGDRSGTQQNYTLSISTTEP
jgi:hypothetical protein